MEQLTRFMNIVPPPARLVMIHIVWWCGTWLQRISVAIIKYSWIFRERGLRQRERASYTTISQLKEAIETENYEEFNRLIEVLKYERTIDLTIADARFQQRENILDKILAFPNVHSAERFYEKLQKNVSDLTLYELVSTSHLTNFTEKQGDLLFRILQDCEYIYTGVTAFCSVKDQRGRNVLHESVVRNPALFIRILNSLSESAGCNINADFYFVYVFVNFGPNSVVGTNGTGHFISLMVQLVVYLGFTHSYVYNVVYFLCERDHDGQTVLDLAAQKDLESYKAILKLVNEVARTDVRGVFEAFRNLLQRDIRIYQSSWRGVFLCIVAILSFWFMLTVIMSDGALLRAIRDTFCFITFGLLWKYGMLPKTFSLLAFIVREVAHIIFIPEEGILSIGMMSYDILINMVVFWVWKTLARRLFEETVFSGLDEHKFYLITASSLVQLEAIDQLVIKPNDFVNEKTRNTLLKKPNIYTYLTCNDKGIQTPLTEASRQIEESRQIEVCRQIKEKLKDLSIIIGIPNEAIIDCGKVHVLALAVHKDRVDSGNETSHIGVMCQRMGYRYHGPVDVTRSQEFIDTLKESLQKINASENPELIFIFLMAHGKADYMYAEGNGIHVTEIIEMLKEQTSDDILKFLYIQTCRVSNEGSPQGDSNDLDPTAHYSQVRPGDRTALRTIRTVNQSGQHPENRDPEERDIQKTVDKTRNLYVHMATNPGDVAVQNTFIWAISYLLSSNSTLFIDPYRVSVKANQICKTFFPAPRLYPSTDIDRYAEIRVPERLFRYSSSGATYEL